MHCKHIARENVVRATLDSDNTMGQGQFVPRNPFARLTFLRERKRDERKWRMLEDKNEQKTKKEEKEKKEDAVEKLFVGQQIYAPAIRKTILSRLFDKYCFPLSVRNWLKRRSSGRRTKKRGTKETKGSFKLELDCVSLS